MNRKTLSFSLHLYILNSYIVLIRIQTTYASGHHICTISNHLLITVVLQNIHRMVKIKQKMKSSRSCKQSKQELCIVTKIQIYAFS